MVHGDGDDGDVAMMLLMMMMHDDHDDVDDVHGDVDDDHGYGDVHNSSIIITTLATIARPFGQPEAHLACLERLEGGLAFRH